jgi:hypothetical protein
MTTNLERLVLNGIKYFQTEYAEGVPVNIMKLDLGLSDDDLRETLLNLEEQGVIFIEGERIKLIEESAVYDSEVTRNHFTVGNDDSAVVVGPELATDGSFLKEADERVVLKKETKDLTQDLTEKEQQAFDIIKELAGDSGRVSRHILEGNLLYGDLKLTNLGAYNLVLSLEIKGIIKKIQRADGEYYVV